MPQRSWEDIRDQAPGFCLKYWKEALFMLLVLGFFVFVINLMKQNDAFTESLERAQHNPALLEKLGTPIEAGFLIFGSTDIVHWRHPGSDGRIINQLSHGSAKLHYFLSGPKGRGSMHVEGSAKAGKWNWTVMRVSLWQGGAVDLLEVKPAPPAEPAPAL